MTKKSGYKNFKVKYNNEIDENIMELKVSGEFNAKPGQFYMLKTDTLDPILSRPISICDIDNEGIRFLYQVKGKGTKIFSDLKHKDDLQLLGPLGNGFMDIDKEKKLAIIAGGIGIAPFLFLLKSLKQKPDIYLGFRSKPYFYENLIEYANEIHIATEDGSYGEKGFVTDLIDVDAYDEIIVCGPNIMMKKVQDMCKNNKLQFSLEAYMACGFGACLGCSVKINHNMKRVCKEGPVFDGKEVYFK